MSDYLSSQSVRQRITVSLFITQSLFSAAMIASFTLMSITAARLSGNDALAGFPNTMNLLARAVTAYPIGWLMDKVGRRTGLSFGYLIGVVGMVVAALAISWGSFVGFCVGAALFGMGRGSAEQSRFVAAEVEVPSRRAKAIGLIVFAGTIGAVGGPKLVEPATVWAGQVGLVGEMGPYLVAAFLIFLSLLMTLFFLWPDPLEIGRFLAAQDDKQNNVSQAPVRPLSQIFRNPTVLLAVTSMVVSQLVMTTIMVITPLHMSHHEHGTGDISNVLMAHTIGMFALSSVTGWLIGKFGRISMILVGTFVLLIASFLAPVSNNVPMLALALFLLGLGWNFCFVAGSSLLSDALQANERGQVQGANEMLVAFASSVGSLSTGALFAQGGMTAVSAAGFVVALVLLGMVLWSAMIDKRSQPVLPA